MGWRGEMGFRDCPWCGLRDAHFNLLMRDQEAQRPSDKSRFWSTLSCPRCAGVVAVETNHPNEAVKAIFSVVPEVRAESDVDHLPEDVDDYYVQARRALDAELPDAATVALRRTLEAASMHFGHDEKSLVKQIEGLIHDGLVTAQFGEVLDHVRKIGNIGAHASDERVDEATAKEVMSFTTQILRNLFEIPAKLQDLRAQGDST